MEFVSQSFSRGSTISKILHSEVDPLLSRRTGTLLGGSGSVRSIVVGTLLGALAVGASTVAYANAAADNVGGGTLTLEDPAFSGSVQEGNYTIRCVEAGGAGVAKFSVEKPDGGELKKAVDGDAYNTHLKFTIAAAGADFALGDTFTVEVTTTDGKDSNILVAWDPTADDGRQKFFGISLVNLEAPDGVDLVNDVEAVCSLAVIKKNGIIWPDGISEQDKAEVLDKLYYDRHVSAI